MLEIKLNPYEHRRIFARIEYQSGWRNEKGCWIWTGAKDQRGYGQGFYRGKKERVHRIVYAFFNGPIPRGDQRKDFQLDHLCRNTSCVNPSHLELVTARENGLRGEGPQAQNARKKVCIYGHPLRKQRNGKRRYCPTCDNARKKR